MTINTSVERSTPIGWLQTFLGRDLSSLFSINMNGLIWSWLGLMALGWVMVMSASTSIAETYTGNAAYFSTRHGIYILIGIVLAFCISRISLSWWQKNRLVVVAIGWFRFSRSINSRHRSRS
jgi:cell division protein FtsW